VSEGARTVGAPALPFRWVVVRAMASPDIVAGEAPRGLLSVTERASLESFRFAQRRRKWLLGRWAAKSLLQDLEMERTGRRPDAASLLILNEPSGLPYAAREAEGRLPLSISISHRSDWSVAGVALDPGASLGIDLETIEPRGIEWCADYFVAHEMDAVRAAGKERDRVVATIWSAKESALKALGIGLRLDTRRIEVKLTPAHSVPAAAPIDGWMPLDLAAGPQARLGDAVRAFSMQCPDYVLTAVVLTEQGR
jgi:4'-phosphopantetheinyl transferase